MGSDAWSGETIPGWHQSEQLRRTYRSIFHPEIINDIYMTKDAVESDPEYGSLIRGSLEHLLAERPATVNSWQALTGYYFMSEEDLYDYLRDLHDYLFGSGRVYPVAREPE